MIVEDPPVPLSIPPLPPHFTSSLPSSPTILLSPSSPPFPSIHLPLESESESKAEKKASNKKLRESLLLLDSRLAELETIGKNRSNEGGAIDFMLGRDPSSRSLASLASGRSSEDAFDIVDFPSIDHFAPSPDQNLGLAISTRLPPSPRNRSSDLMAFPIPPTDISAIPLEETGGSSDTSLDDEQVFEHLASLGDGQSVQGLGLYSSSNISRPSSRLARSETETDSACSHQSSSLDTSTLASSYAPTLGFGRSTTSFTGFGKEEPPQPIYARRAATARNPICPPPAIFTSVAAPSTGVPATLGSPFSLPQDFPPSPASLSPYSFTESPRQSPTLTSPSNAPFRASTFPPPAFSSPHVASPASPSPSLSRSSSRQDFGFAELHQASVGLLGSFDYTGIPMWDIQPEDRYARNARAEEEEDEKLEILQDLSPPSQHRFESSSPAQKSPMGTLRRLSSFQILRSRKSDNSLFAANAPSSRPPLSKPKSEASLSTLARRQGGGDASNKENAETASAPPNRLRLSLRSKSSPRLSKLSSPPPVPKTSTSTPTPKKTPRSEEKVDAAGFASPTSGSSRKRFSIFTSRQFSPASNETVPPVPATPTEHLPTQRSKEERRPQLQVDAVKANEKEPPQLEARDTASPSITPSSASFPTTPVSLSAAAAAPASSPTVDESISLSNFLESTSPKSNVKDNERSKSPFGDRTNWSRPTSPALLDALKLTNPLDLNDLVVVPQRVTVFPVRLPPPPPGAIAAAKEEEAKEEEGEDSYGDDSDSEEDKPLGVTVPGALTAQKSLRKTMSTKKTKSRPKEDPFEFERTAALLKTPTMSRNPSSASTNRDTVNKNTQGHDSFLPQSDASIARKASSNGLRRSPSTPLDPMIANSALTLDSPVLTQEPLPMPIRRNSRPGASSSEALNSPPVAPPRSRPPPIPVPTHTSRQPDQGTSSVPPPLNRRPSLHPDVAHIQSSSNMQRQASSSSSKSASDSAYPAQRPSPGARSRSGTLSAVSGPSVDHRVYLHRAGAKHLTIKVTDRTVAGEVVAYAKGKGALEGGNDSEGGWALWEVWQAMGLERPIREYELLNDIIKSFEGDSGVFVLRRAMLWPILSAHARVHPVAPKSAQVQLELKKGKWSKRFLELKDGTLSHSKSEKGKDSNVLCQLSNFSVFYVDQPTTLRLKAPKPFVFALKSRLQRANFEEISQYCNFVSVKSAGELDNWITSITEAGNSLFRQREQAILGVSNTPALPSPPLALNKPATSPVSLPSVSTESKPSDPSPRAFCSRTSSARPAPAVLARGNNENVPPTRRPTLSKPLVDLSR